MHRAAGSGGWHVHSTRSALVSVLASLALFATVHAAQVPQPRAIRVVVDSNYAPYSFETSDGKVQGILIDQWQAWEDRTGIDVDIHAMDWDDALRRMRAGEFDVIESIVETPARRAYFDFSPVYTMAEASIYFRGDISGISDLDSLEGFPVGVKAGDQHIEKLKAHGVTTVIAFPNNEAIVQAAKHKQINVFLIDDPSALYLLNKLDIRADFRHSAPVFRDEVRRAVRKGDTATLRTVSAGFAAIDPRELAAIDEKWFGRSLDGSRYVTYAGYVAAAALALMAALFAWNRSLRKGILQRTAALGESEERFRQIAASIREVFWMSTPGMDELIYVSPAYESIWGRSLESLRREPSSFTDAIHQDDRRDALDVIEAARETAFEITYRIVRPDGRIRWIRDRGFPVRDDTGRVYRVAGIAEDITGSKAIDEALRQSEFDLAQAQRLARIGNWSFDVGSNAIRWSDELYRIFDIDRETFVGDYETFFSRVHPDDRARVIQINDEARTSGRHFEVEYRIVTRTGQQKHIREVGYARTTPDGTVYELFGTAQDITDQKHTEQALRDSGAELQALSRRLVELQEFERKELARELHDRVGQNLTALNINMSLLAASLPSQATEGLRARLADSETLIEATAAAIRNVLTELRPPLLDDQGLLAALGWQAREISTRLGIPVVVHGDADTTVRPAPEVEIVLFRIAQEALNNVAKHARARRVDIFLGGSGSEHVMSVRDDGVGFDVVKQSEAGHAGLGIVTMRERSQAVGGSFEVRTLPGDGTQLTVRVPA